MNNFCVLVAEHCFDRLQIIGLLRILFSLKVYLLHFTL